MQNTQKEIKTSLIEFELRLKGEWVESSLYKDLHQLFFDKLKQWQKYDRFALGLSYPFESDKQIIWDQFTKQQAISFKHKEDKLILAGSPRHDNFFISEIFLVHGLSIWNRCIYLYDGFHSD